MIVNRDHKVIAFNRKSSLGTVVPLNTAGKAMGSYPSPSGTLLGFALTPGYETYKGLGWHGVIEQELAG